jgi:hypothetical protein
MPAYKSVVFVISMSKTAPAVISSFIAFSSVSSFSTIVSSTSASSLCRLGCIHTNLCRF